MTFTTILSAAAKAKLDTERVRDLFHLLNLPFTIVRFPMMLRELRHLLSLIERMWPLELRKLDLLWMPRLVEKLSSLFPVVEDSESRKPGIEQLKKRNPLYSSLIERCQISDEQLKTNYDLLFAHVVMASIKVMKKTDRGEYELYKGDELWNKIEFSPYYACLAIRDFATNDVKSSDLLKAFPVHLRPATFAGRARLLEVPNVDLKVHRWVSNWIRYISGFVEAAHDLRDRRYAAERLMVRSDIGDPGDPNANVGGATVHEQTPGDFEGKKLGRGGKHRDERERRRKEALEADNCPEEDEEEDQQIIGASYEPSGDAQGESHFDKSPESYRGMVRAIHNQVIRENKNFAFGYERLMPFELAKIEVKCRRDLMRLLQRNSLSQYQEAEDLALLLATLWLGKGRAPHLKIVDNVADQTDVEYALVRPTDKTPSMFRMQVEFPTYKSLQKNQEDDRRRFPYVLLPDYFDLAGLLIQLYDVQLRSQPHDDAMGRIFPHEREQYPRLGKMLEDLDPSRRMTISKISAALSGYVTSQTGNDVVAAKIITGFDSRVSRVAMFYACRSQANINRIFHRCASWLLQEIWEDSEIYKEAPKEYFDPDWHDWYIGVRLCPTKVSVNKGVARILAGMRKPGIELVEYHNLLMLYTVLFFGYATLIRGIRDPLVLAQAVSPLTHMALVRDKTSDSGDKAKYVCIPKSLRDHLVFFDKHLERPDLTKDPTRTFFFYKEGGGFEDVKPSTIAARLNKFIPFPAAVHRRFSFNELIESGCPPEVVRVCMGHSTVGDEPWSRSSTFSFSRFQKVLSPYVQSLLTSLGFEAPDKTSGQEGA